MKPKQKFTNTLVRNLPPEDRYYEVGDSLQPGLVVRVQPSGKKTYYCWYRMPTGKRGILKLGNAMTFTAAEARQMARQHILAAAGNIDPNDLKREAKVHTLGTFIDDVYFPRATHKTSGETIQRVKRCFPDLLNKPLSDIRPMRIENWKKSRIDAGKKHGSVNRDLSALHGVLSRAVDWEYLDVHPLRRVKKFKEDIGKPRYLSPDELTKLYAALEAHESKLREKRCSFNLWRRGRSLPELQNLNTTAYADHLRPMTLLALNTGMRRGEIFNLKWEDVTLGDSPSLVIHGHSSKGGKTRHIPLNRAAVDMLTGWKAQTSDTGLVFKSPKTGGRFDNISTAWRGVIKAAEIGSFRFHDCRHHFASMLVQRGVDLNTVRELLGHSDLKLTLRYAHLAPANAAKAVAVLDEPENVIPIQQEVQFP